MKSLEELALQYQNELRKKYPDTIVMQAEGIFTIFGIPDEKEEEYLDYIHGDFTEYLINNNIEYISMMIYTDKERPSS